MISLSTSWNIRRASSAHDALMEVRRLGLDIVELSWVCREDLDHVFELVRRGEIVVSSIHSPCGVHPCGAAPGCFHEDDLASTDVSKRRRAVDAVKRSIEVAVAAGARAVVVHLGYVAVDGHTLQQRLMKLCRSGEAGLSGYRGALRSAIAERAGAARAHLDAAMQSIGEILPSLHGGSVRLALENRDYYHQIPNQEDMRIILSEFSGAPISYWHDVGHEEIPRRVGWLESSWIPEFVPCMVGCHLHDVMGFSDHLAPGRGKLDFAEILQQLPKDAVKVVEVSCHESAEGILGAVEMLRRLEDSLPVSACLPPRRACHVRTGTHPRDVQRQ